MSDSQLVQDVQTLITELATTPGPTGGEEPRREFLRSWLAKAGVESTHDDAGNLWVDLSPDAPWEQSVAMDAHLDVVGRGVADRVVTEDGKLIGAGVADNLAAVAMLAVYAREVVNAKGTPSRPVKIIFTVGEEGLGNLRGVRQITADADTAPLLYIAFDGSYHKCHVAGLGSNRYSLAVHCGGGHSWGAYGAPSATERLVDFLTEIKQTHARLAEASSDVLSYNIGSLAGGEGINCISREAEATFEFRSADPAALGRMDRAVHEILERADTNGKVRSELHTIGRRPAAKPFGNDVAENLLVRIWANHGVRLHTNIASTNINIPLAHGWPAICVGLCAGGNGHREDEYVMIDSLDTGWRLLNELAARLGEL